MILLLISLASIMLLEEYLLLSWNRTYFATGIRFFNARIPAPAVKREHMATDSLERDVGGNTWLAQEFHFMPDGSIAFREGSIRGTSLHRYFPIMHGRIEVDAERNEIRVIGLCNLVVLALPPALLFQIVLAPDTWPVVSVTVIFIAAYFVQRKAYRCVVDAVRRQLAEAHPHPDPRETRTP